MMAKKDDEKKDKMKFNKRGANPNSLKNLEKNKFQPGQSGNPNGRPKRLPITDRYIETLEKKLPAKLKRKLADLLELDETEETKAMLNDLVYGEAIALGQVYKAISKTDAAREVREAVEGKTIQRLRLEGPEGGPVQIEETSEDVDELKARVLALTKRIRSRSGKS